MITSSSNQQMKNLSALLAKSKERKKQKSFVVEGAKMVFEAPFGQILKVYVSETYENALDNKKALLQLQERVREAQPDFSYEVVADSVFKSVSDTQTPQGILAVVKMPEYEFQDLLDGEKTQILVLESIQDPGNLGTMFRTGEGAGVTGVLMNKTTVDLFNPKTIRSTMGSIYRVPFYVVEDLQGALRQLKQEGVKLYAAHLKGSAMYDEFDYTTACGFLIGNEGNGLSDDIADLADTYIKIPMEGKVESLNAAVSGALLMYEANRQRRTNS